MMEEGNKDEEVDTLPKRPRGRPKKRRRMTVTPKEKVVDAEKKAPQKVRKKEKTPVRSSSRTKKKPVKDEIITNEKWTKAEKKLLLEALKIHNPTDHNILSRLVKTKTPHQVDLFLQRMNRYAEYEGKGDPNYLSVPIDNWISLGRDIIVNEQKDYTECFKTIMSVISHFEEFTPPSKHVPDYRAIYRYLSCIFMEKELPYIGPLESTVVLDLLHSLVEVLRSHGTATQRQVMKWKHELLMSGTGVPQVTIKKARKAFTNDFSDFLAKNASTSNQSNTTQNDNRQPQESVSSNSQSENATQNITRNQQSQDPASSNNDVKPRKRGCKRKCDEVKEELPKKPSLFTLNPFCIPVNLLNLKQRKMIYNSNFVKPQQVDAIVPMKRGPCNYMHPITRAKPIIAYEAYCRQQNP